MNCWFVRRCNRKDICNDLKTPQDCVRYNQMYMQTQEAGIPGVFPIKHVLEKPNDPSSPDYNNYAELNKIATGSVAFVEQGKSLVIESSCCGNGKTTWAQVILLAYLSKQLGKSNSGYFINLPQALHDIKKIITTNEILPYEDAFSNARLLVLDDLGHKKYTEYEENWLLRVLSQRQFKNLATIYTVTHRSGEAGKQGRSLSALIGERLFSRIYTASERIHLFEGDKRGLANKKE